MNIKLDTINKNKEIEKTSSLENFTTEKNGENNSFQSFLEQNNFNFSEVETSLFSNIISMYDMPYSAMSDIALSIQGIKSSFNFDTLNISAEDAIFFDNLLKHENYQVTSTTSFNATLNLLSTEETTNVGVSKTLMNLIEKAHKTQQPIRLDFDNNISVILRIDKDGKITAEFLPSDAAAEQYLRNNISFLKNNLEQQNIVYNDIFYRKNRNNRNSQQHHKGDDTNE